MKSILLAAFLAVALRAFAQLPQDEIFHTNNPGVFMLTATEPGGTTHIGSAFCLKQEGILVTTYHTIANASSASIRSVYGKDIRVLGTLATDPGRDLAILKVDDAGLTEIQAGQSEYIRANELVSIIAPSAPAANAYLQGKIRPEYKQQRAAEEYQPIIPVDGKFIPQYNGAPLLSGSGGRAMGVLLVSDSGGASQSAIAIPIEAVNDLMKSLSENSEPLSPKGNYFGTKEGMYWKGRLDEVRGDYESAIANYRASLAIAADYYPAIFQLGFDAELRADHATAQESYKKAQRFAQTLSDASFNLGLIYLAASDYGTAEQDFNAAAERNGKFVKAFDKLGESYEKDQQQANALTAYMKARDVKPTDTYSNLRIAHILFDQQKWKDAAKAAKTAREAGVDSVDVYLIESDSWFHVKDYLQAWDLANRGTQRKSGIARFWYIMAASDMKTKHPDRVKKEMDKLRALDPDAAKELTDSANGQ